jgi:V/A-type H+/Na+-transporting ATPase subunit D
MATVKLTKTELRAEQVKLGRLQKYLPTLQLKKAMLQVEVNAAHAEIEQLFLQFAAAEDLVGKYALLLSDKGANDLFTSVKIHEVKKNYENIAGIDIPHFEKVVFEPSTYSLFDTPVWLESAISGIKNLIIVRENIKTVQEKKRALEKELREVSIRVNLFEKIMIPRTLENIKKIRIFLGDQQLSAVSQAKVAKNKILLRNLEKKK